MRRGSATVVALAGDVRPGVAEAAAAARNVVFVPAPGDGVGSALTALERADGRSSTYALVTADPLADLGRTWRSLWEETPRAVPDFETAAKTLLEAARGRTALPDYYIVVAAANDPTGDPRPHPHDFYLGVLASVRPARVGRIAPGASVAEDAARIVAALPALGQGPWWPALDAVVATARDFFPRSLIATAVS
jgi:hypothetical protein